MKLHNPIPRKIYIKFIPHTHGLVDMFDKKPDGACFEYENGATSGFRMSKVYNNNLIDIIDIRGFSVTVDSTHIIRHINHQGLVDGVLHGFYAWHVKGDTCKLIESSVAKVMQTAKFKKATMLEKNTVYVTHDGEVFQYLGEYCRYIAPFFVRFTPEMRHYVLNSDGEVVAVSLDDLYVTALPNAKPSAFSTANRFEWYLNHIPSNAEIQLIRNPVKNMCKAIIARIGDVWYQIDKTQNILWELDIKSDTLERVSITGDVIPMPSTLSDLS